MRSRPRVLAIATAAIVAASCQPGSSRDMSSDSTGAQNGPITLAVVNARIWTGDSARPWAEALAVRDDRIATVGSSAAVRKLAGNARVIDAGGKLIVPGFIDSHVHFVDGGFRLSSVQLRDAKTPAEFIARIKAFAATAPKGAWITGGDWDHELWGGELPRRDWIDSVTPNNPVWVNRLDGHMALANSAALAAAKITKGSNDVAGGTIVRGATGEPTGVLKDNAMDAVFAAAPSPPPELEDRALDAAMAYVAAQGVTSIHNMGSWNDLAIFDRGQKANRLRTRIYAAVPLATWEKLRDTVAARGRGNAWLRIGALKGFVDGSLGSHTAAMLEPFTDAPNDTGLFVNTPENLYQWVSGADKAGLNAIVHAIGDKAIRTQLDIFERVAKENGPRDRRFRIEHAQHIAPPDIPRFGQIGVIASMQPYHAIDDGRWAEKVIGPERAKGTYAFRSLRDAGATLAFGSDWFVAPPTPLEGIYAAVTRRTLDDRNPGGWVPEQKITVEDALRAYTRGGAYASFDEREKGILTTGALADFAIIDRDITQIPPEQIRDAHVTLTTVGGRVVFEAKGGN
jgi:predicted amidohydrolase YtcJ